MKRLIFEYNFIEICSLGFNWQWGNTGSDHGLAPVRRQAMIWTNANLLSQIYSTCLDDLMTTCSNKDQANNDFNPKHFSSFFSTTKLVTFHFILNVDNSKI